jgi:hypothetical protein
MDDGEGEFARMEDGDGKNAERRLILKKYGADK